MAQFNALEKMAEQMKSICQYDLSSETSSKFSELEDHGIDDEFYQYALNELITNFAKAEFENAQSNDDNIEISQFQLEQSLHAACDKYLQTQFF